MTVQEFIDGEEDNVIALGDGSGNLLGAVPMKTRALTDKGKGWAWTTIKAPELIELAAQFMKATQWASGCEIELIRNRQGNHHVIEINALFPAWVHKFAKSQPLYQSWWMRTLAIRSGAAASCELGSSRTRAR